MYVEKLVIGFCVLFCFSTSVQSQERTAVMAWNRGVQLLAVPLQSPQVATVADLAAITSSPVVFWTEGGRQRRWVRYGSGFASPVRGDHAYLVFCPRAGSVNLVGAWWSAALLAVERPRGLSWVANIRPNSAAPLGQFFSVSGLLGMTRLDERGHWQLIESRTRDSAVAVRPFEPGQGYGLLCPTTATAIVLPNSNQPPKADTSSIPLTATTNARIGLVAQSTDPDDEVGNLTHQWQLVDSALGTVRTTVGQSAYVALTMPATLSVRLESSDGMLRSQIETGRTKRAVVATTTPEVAEVTYTGGEHVVDCFGMRSTLPYLFNRVEPQSLPVLFPAYRLAHRRSSSIPSKALTQQASTTQWYEIDLSAIADRWVSEIPYFPFSPAWPVATVVSIDTSISTTDPWGVDVITEIPIDSSTPLRFYNFTPRSIGASKTIGEHARRAWTAQLLPRLQRFAPVNLLARATAQVTYDIVAVNPENDPKGKIAVVMFHGYDVRSEFLGVGPAFLQAQQRWPHFFGAGSDHAYSGIAHNIRDLEQKFVFYLAIYRTTDSQEEIARQLGNRLAATVFAGGKRPQCLFIGYSMGGVVARRTRCLFLDTGERIGQFVKAVLTIGSPHHGAALPSSLEGGVFNHLAERLLQSMSLESIEPFISYGAIPPSLGLRSLAYDATIVDANGRHADATLNPELTRFNQEDFYRGTPNLSAIAGGTSGPPLSDPGLEIARREFEYKNITARGFPDGLVVTQSSLPLDLAQLKQSGGSTDPFIGRKSDGTVDRLGYYEGDHYELLTNPEIICAVHSWVAQFAGNDHAPHDLTPDEIDHPFEYGASSADVKITQALGWDDDGDTLQHNWSIACTIPRTIAFMTGEATATPTITVLQPTNVLLWHTLRDGRGGITTKLIDVFVYAPGFYGCHEVPRYSLTLRADSFGRPYLNWSSSGSGCLPQNPSQASLWTDPTNDATRTLPKFDHAWPHRTLYYYYSGPSINNGPPVFSNVAIVRPSTFPRIP